MASATVREISIRYDDTGTGTPVVLVHGHPFDRTMWREQVDRLGTGYRIIAPDLRGYGNSTVVPGVTLLDDFACDIAVLLDGLGVDRFVLGGLSMGGQIVLEFYRRFPDRVRALVLADTFAKADDEGGRRWRNDMADRLLREGMNAYADEVLPKMISPKTIREQPDVAEHVLRMMRDTAPEGAAAALRGRARRRDYSDLLADIAVPTLLVVGRDDEFTPVGDAEFMHEHISDSRLVVVDGAGHMPNIERPNEFNRAVADFLARVEA